jgi:hypothetical protein
MQVLNKFEKEELVIKMHQDGKTIREIASAAHMSFGDIAKVIRRIDGPANDDSNNNSNDVNLSSKSTSTQALYLFEHGKKPIDVAIQLDISYREVEDLLQEFWGLKGLYDLAFLFMDIKNDLTPFLKLFRLLKQSKMLGEDHISKFIRYAGHDLPSLENKFQSLSGDVIDFQWKKNQYQDELAILGSAISQQRHALNVIQTAIELKKQILAEWDNKLNGKIASIHSTNKQT